MFYLEFMIMKKIILLASVMLSLGACSSVQNKQEAAPSIGMANPASKYCVDQGGTLEIVKEERGDVGYCNLKNGQKVEEWALYRQNQPQCIAEEATKLVGQNSTLTDDQVKQATKSNTVRRVGPNQPMTMDFRSDRITLLIDPSSKKITQATCG